MAILVSEDAPVWLITGSSQGLGKALLDTVLSSGQRVVATLRRPEVLAEYRQKYPPSRLLVTRLDVSDNNRIVEVFEEVKEHFGRLDVVVNNAGYSMEGEIEVTPDSEARRLFEVLFWGVVNVSKQALVFMRDINPPGLGGRILNMSSIAGYSATPVFGFYAAAKFAVEGFTESLNKEMVPEWNIKAIIIEPGGFNTNVKSAMITLPVPPQYAAPDTPSSVFRNIFDKDFMGDPVKAAQAMLLLVKEPDPPLRLQLGSDCVKVVREAAERTLLENKKWERLGNSTNLDTFTKDAASKQFNNTVS